MVSMGKPQNRNRETMAQLLRRHGIAPTHQRIEIAHVLFTRREHLSADQILKGSTPATPKRRRRRSTTR